MDDPIPVPHPPIVTNLAAKNLDPLHMSPEVQAYFAGLEEDTGSLRPTRKACTTQSILSERMIDRGPPEDLVIQYSGEQEYEGLSLLRWSRKPQKQHPGIPVKTTRKKQWYSDIAYPTVFTPPEEEDIGDDYFSYNEDEEKVEKSHLHLSLLQKQLEYHNQYTLHQEGLQD